MKKNKLEHSWMERYAPVGSKPAQEVRYWILTMTISTLWTMSFLLNYYQERANLYESTGTRIVLIEGAMMPAFEFMTRNLFEVFILVFVYCIMIAVYHYFYHYQGSKMMYLMKRLPNKWELHIRCWTLPIAACVITAVWMLILKMLYYAIYILCTPSQCLPL